MTYDSTNADLPNQMFPDAPAEPQKAQKSDPPKRSLVDARYAVRKQAFELGLHIDDHQVKLCTLILFAVWEDEDKKQK